MIKNSEIIYNYICKRTLNLIKSKKIDGNGVDATDIALALKLERSNVSRELNALWKKGYIIKIGGRPVLFLDHKALSDAFPHASLPSFIPKNTSLINYLNEIDDVQHVKHKNLDYDLDNIIGSNGSLTAEIEKAKAAVSYPPYGLCTIVSGNPGTGKSTFTKGMINFALSNNIRSNHVPTTFVSCRNYNDAISFEKYFFGYVENGEKKRGLISKSNDGFIVLENIEYLYPSTLNLLMSTISTGYYNNINSLEELKLKAMIILTTDLPLENEKIKNLSSYIPVKITLRDIDSRGSYEKIELILDLFSKEVKSIKRNVKVSKDVIYWLSTNHYKLNTTQLKNDIKNTLSSAHFDSINAGSPIVNVSLNHIPTNLLALNSCYLDKEAISSNVLNIIDSNFFYFDSEGISDEYTKYRNYPSLSASHLMSQFIDEFNVNLDTLTDMDNYVSENINCLASLDDVQLKGLRKNINPYVLQVVKTYLLNDKKYSNLYKHQELLYGILLHITNSIDRYQNNSPKNPSVNVSSASAKLYPIEYSLANDIMSSISERFNICFDSREIDFLCNYLVITNNWVNKSKIAVLVIAHGENIASDMINFVKNTIDGEYFVDSIDFRKDIQLNDLMEIACVKAININQGLGVLIITDKEPLLTVGDYIMRKTGILTKTINPLSLTLLIDIIKKVKSPGIDLSSFNNKNSVVSISPLLDDERNKFIENITDRVIAKTLVFLDAKKAVKILSSCLNTELEKLHITYSDEIAAKYLCHTTNMLERVIKNEPWENQNLNKFIRSYPKLMEITEHSLETASNSFGIKIPKNELVFIAEIFLPYINEQS